MHSFQKKHLYLFLVLSSILLSLPWFKGFSGVILFIAFVPLLVVERVLYEQRSLNRSSRMFLYSFYSFIVWNILTTFWIYHATLFGAIAAVLVNSFLMAGTFWLFHITHRRLGHKYGYFSLITYWTGFEYIYLNIQVSWPWLNLGNGFAKDIKLIQWFEFTGATGATPWILFINVLFFILIWEFFQYQSIRKRIYELVILVIVVCVPLIFSIFKFHHYTDKGPAFNVVIVQPNIDPYNEKFGSMTNAEQLSVILRLADSLTGPSTDYVVAPETAIDDNIHEDQLRQNTSVRRIQSFVYQHPRVKFITGMVSYYFFKPGETVTPTAREYGNTHKFYDAYNASLEVDVSGRYQVYHKSKLVIGVEMVPFPKLMKKFRNLIIDLGGATGSYGTQKERSLLISPDGKGRVGTAICYESVYGEYLTGYVKKGANLIFVITNDGWWGNSSGYRQHLTYSSLRAIETRRGIARSANTGISCFISQKGEISQATPWWEPTAISGNVHANNEETFYVQHGDFISRISLFFGILVLLYNFSVYLISKKKK